MSRNVTSSSGDAIAADGASIAYTLHAAEGSSSASSARPRIALIHSLALDRSFWDGVVPLLTPHADVLAYDCRGHGKSAKTRMTYTAELFAGDLADLLDHVGWPRAIIAGCSMGGCVAQAFAGVYPDRAQALAVMDSTAWYGPTAPKDWRDRADTAVTKGLAALIGFQATRWVSDGFRESYPDVMRKHMDVFLANDVECYRATCEMLGGADLRHYQAAMRIPISVVVGEEDYATPVAMSEQIQKAVPNATLAVLPKVRHLTPIECPQLIAEKILTLVKQV
jgi:3-oxoadipate enol-lactonase